MTSDRRILELLAPAKNADFGIEAINHGADAVYIGGPSFGARKGADNEVADIARLAAHAHRFHAKVFVAFNTILRDDELEPARQTIHQLYDAGVDALIVQDMGLLEMDLPPIQLHASTQTDIRDAAKARFLQDVGFSQIVLARELTLEQIRDIASNTSCSLEFFVHGALCVAFSGQCFISHAHTARSANRGECSQACRLPYTLTDASGAVVAHDKHLLSMKDNDQSTNLRALIDAGISSFKIEGRLKDLAYVKNITAHYRTLLDDILDDLPAHRRASSGRCTFFFTPQPEKSFNRGATDYFVNGRQHGIEAFEAPGFVGEEAATVTRVAVDHIEVESQVDIHNGDGLSYFDSHRELQGLRINTVHGKQLVPNVMPDDLKPGLTLFRNRDQAFERALEKKSSERRVAVDLRFADTPEGFALTLTDEDGCTARADIAFERQPARDAERALAGIREAIAKLGNTMFEARTVTLDTQQAWFLRPAPRCLRKAGSGPHEGARTTAAAGAGRTAGAVHRHRTELSRQRVQREGAHLLSPAWRAADRRRLRAQSRAGRGVADDHQALPALQPQPVSEGIEGLRPARHGEGGTDDADEWQRPAHLALRLQEVRNACGRQPAQIGAAGAGDTGDLPSQCARRRQGDAQRALKFQPPMPLKTMDAVRCTARRHADRSTARLSIRT